MSRATGSTGSARTEADDRRSDLSVLVGTIVVGFIVFGVATVPQVAVQSTQGNTGSELLTLIAGRIVVNLALLLVALVLVVLLNPIDHRGGRVVADAIVIALIAALVRVPLQVLRGIYTSDRWQEALIESATVSLIVLALVGLGLAHVVTRRRIREQERASARQTLIASAALDALATEELRVRRDVAEGLHGTVQQNLVLLAVRVDAIGARLAAAGSTDAEDLLELHDIRETIDGIRETDVRTLSQLLYPVGLELGAVAALRLLLQRLPGTIASSVQIDAAVLALEGNGNTSLTIDRRLLLVRIVEEALSNSLRHGRASSVRLGLELRHDVIVMTFDDDGYGLGPAPQPSGLARFRERLLPLGGSIEFGDDSPLGGTRLIARVPVGASVRPGPSIA